MNTVMMIVGAAIVLTDWERTELGFILMILAVWEALPPKEKK